MTQNNLFRILAGTLGLAALLFTLGCSGQHSRNTVQNDEPTEAAAPVPMVSTLKMNAPSASVQLVKGFSGLENSQWRWTAGNFSVVLKTPPGAAAKGGALTFGFTISDAVLKQVHSQTLSASIGDKTLGSQKYTEAGAHIFGVDIPPTALAGDTVTIDFSLDQSLPPSPSDRRELGVIATAVGLESK